MGHVEKISVALTTEMASMMREAVETGEYASASEVIREALRDWKLRRSQRRQAVEELRNLWDEVMAGGPSVEGEEAFVRIRKRLDARLVESGID